MLSLIQNGWAVYSFASTCFGLGGVALIAGALVLAAYLPAFLKETAIVAGAVLLAFAGGLQAGQMRGAHAAFAEDRLRAVAAEAKRAELSERQAAEDRAQAAKDLADAQTDNAKLKELTDALKNAPGRDCPALGRDTARRLRNL